MALYGKYRPKNFAEMVGQEAPKKTLLNAIKLEKLAHAYLFCGTRGTGKTSAARILAKAINCTAITETGDPCTQCDLCQLAETERLTDIIEIDAASNRGIDEIRDLREKVVFAPNTGKAKIYIIDEVHMLTKEAFNALLKTLEEPPSHAYFILATTEYHKVPETIRSRCQTFFFTNISINNISDRLKYICDEEKFEYEIDGLKILAKRAAGGLRDAISLLEQSSNFGPITPENLRKSLGIISSDFLEKFLFSLQSCDVQQAFSLIEALQNEGRSLEEFGKDFLGYLQELFHEYMQTKNALLPWVLEVIEIFEEGLQRSKRFEIPPLALEMAIAKTMLLKKEFTNQLQNISAHVPINTDKKMGNHKDTSLEKQETPPWETDGIDNSFPTEEFPKDEIINKESIKTTAIKTQATKEINNEFPEIANPFAPINDLFPPAKNIIPEIEQEKTPPWEDSETSKVEINSNVSQQKNNINSKTIDFAFIISQWKEMCKGLPGSIKLSLIQYGNPQALENNTIVLTVESESVKTMLKSEKNIKLIQEAFTSFLKMPITIEFSNEEIVKKSNDEMSISEVESLLQF